MQIRSFGICRLFSYRMAMPLLTHRQGRDELDHLRADGVAWNNVNLVPAVLYAFVQRLPNTFVGPITSGIGPVVLVKRHVFPNPYSISIPITCCHNASEANAG